MDKGIRPYCNAKFVELNEVRRRGGMTDREFRKAVMDDIIEAFGITLASAATHYNHAFKELKKLNAELVSGLGRPEDKKGGRKRKQPVNIDAAAEQPAEPEPVATPAVEQTVFEVRRVKDDSVVASGLSKEAAEALVAKAAAAKKAKLRIV